MPNGTKQHEEVADDEEGRSNEPDPGEGSRYQTRLIQHEAQQRVIYGRHETLPEEEDAVIQGDKRMAGDQPT